MFKYRNGLAFEICVACIDIVAQFLLTTVSSYGEVFVVEHMCVEGLGHLQPIAEAKFKFRKFWIRCDENILGVLILHSVASLGGSGQGRGTAPSLKFYF